MKAVGGSLDPIDRRILREIQSDGRLSVVALARRVGLSKTPCMERLRRLEAGGFVQGYGAHLDPDRLGAGHLAFVQVTLGTTTSAALEAFNRGVEQIAEVQGCYMIAANFDYLLKVRTRDIQSYRRVLGERIAALPHVTQTSTFVVMETVKDTLSVPVGADDGKGL
ncbi:Lrp/AsnC ligand binding domain-containing protein [Varunaivibrio sulfuroxidans]|uniref:AsnC family transcriptional regulator n=1 Tax=Varunaivibrio sulfuroxidans TaxID=1773489 RepID=A0A4R3J5S8_9PROT|nr:Lrp/AsnC ligand binding domain-containing protein [Varunaivibrio sulfuroxidans]TCS60685.1 AsnC family transcriptional regulator [Varunaivibrio sulfuroxidans]WES30174.1 Lrp/AsnC ligand binding domain-containing protein [Varunaivibrio sulfuroxidans]